MSHIFSVDDLRRIACHASFRRFDYFQQLDSTNDHALSLAVDESIETPTLVLTRQQTSGRGRAENRWWSAPGALTFSMLLSTAETSLPPQRHGLVALTVGLAVCETLATLLPSEAQVRLKWPNDVFVGGRKVCGILVEVPPHRYEKMIVGVGINVDNSLAEAPEEIRAIATALCDETTQRNVPTDVLLAVLQQFDTRWQSLGQGTDLSRDWHRYCLLSGRTVHLQVGPQTVAGICEGIDREGALLLRTENGLERHFSGVVANYE